MQESTGDVAHVHARQLSVDTGLGLYGIPETNTENGCSTELTWHDIDLASAFTVYIEHRRPDGSDCSADSASDYFGMLAVELTAQTSNAAFCLEPWSSPLILAEASKVSEIEFCVHLNDIHQSGC